MRDLTTEKRKEIIQSLEGPKVYGSEKYSHKELAIHQCFLADQAEDALKEAKDAYDEKKDAANAAQKALDQANAEVERAIERRNICKRNRTCERNEHFRSCTFLCNI